jgi:hypothetical protein
MKKSFLNIAAFAAVVLGAAALVASARRSSSTSTTTGTDTPTTPDPDPAPRSATRDELAALLRRHMREPRTGGGRTVPVTRIHSTRDTTGRKRAVMFPDLSPEVRDAFVIFLYEEVGKSHMEISYIVALSPRAIAHRLHAVGAVRYAGKAESSQNRNNLNQ